jgi:hypothetical protein
VPSRRVGAWIARNDDVVEDRDSARLAEARTHRACSKESRGCGPATSARERLRRCAHTGLAVRPPPAALDAASGGKLSDQAVTLASVEQALAIAASASSPTLVD